MRRWPLSLLLVAFASCKEPTQVVVEAYTNVAYRAGIVTSFTVGKPGETERADPTTETTEPWSSDFVGSLVVVPGTADDATLSVKLVMGVDRNVHECAPPDYAGCIVARRRIRYSPHERLRLPVTLYAACKGVPCDPDSTCSVLGQCVPVQTTCAGDTCLVAGEPDPRAPDAPPLDASADGSPAGDASPDVLADAPADAPAGDDGGVLGGGDGGAADIVGSIDCRTRTCSAAANENCCYDTNVHGASGCGGSGTACALGGSNIYELHCDHSDDCTAGQVCCFTGSGFFCGNSCPFDRIACTPNSKSSLCPAPTTCTGRIDGYYGFCQP